MDLKDRLALVTGAAHGIGAATARRFAAAGATVIIADVDADGGMALAAELGAPHRFVRLDVASAAAWEELAAAIAAEFGGLDIVHLNAGIAGWPLGQPHSGSGLDTLSSGLIDRLLPINLGGIAHGIAHCFPLVEARGGTIVVTGSTSAINQYVADPIYSAAKAGALALVKALHAEFAARGVKLCAVSPGAVETRIIPDTIKDAARQRGLLASSEFIAEAVMTAILEGKPGDWWIARGEDRGFWVFEPNRLPAAGEPIPQGARFVAARA